jgi:hypothetical protein
VLVSLGERKTHYVVHCIMGQSCQAPKRNFGWWSAVSLE